MEHATNQTLKVSAALKNAQAKFDKILKDTDNPYFKSKYAALDQVIAATRPHLAEFGLVLTQKNIQENERYGIETTLLHLESGEHLPSRLLAKPKEDTIQQIASVLTYVRRYEYLTILGLAPEDDDGAEASGTSAQKAEHRPQSTQPRPPQKAQSTLRATPNTTSTAIAANPSHDPAPARPESHPVAPKSTEPKASPAVSATSDDPLRLPTKAEYDAFVSRSVKIIEALQKAGLTNSKSLPARTKFKNYICRTFQVAKPEELQFAMWSAILGTFEERLGTAAGTQEAAKLVEAASEKEK